MLPRTIVTDRDRQPIMADAHLRPSTASPTRWRFTFLANQAQVAAMVEAAGAPPALAERPAPFADLRLEMN